MYCICICIVYVYVLLYAYVLFSAANQTPTASVKNGNQDQIPLHSIIGLNDGFT